MQGHPLQHRSLSQKRACRQIIIHYCLSSFVHDTLHLTISKKLKQATFTSRTHDSILATPAINLSINLVIVIISFVIFTTFEQL